MSNAEIIIQIMLITIGMIILRIVLNYILGLRKEALREMREKALNLQERIKNAQLIGDSQLILQTQQESVQFMKIMMKKQFVPMCISCSIFLVIFAIIGIFYSRYTNLLPFPLLFFGSGWIAIYFIFSISFSLIIYGVKRLYKKITGKETKTQNSLREIMGMVSPTQQDAGLPLHVASSTQTHIRDYGDTSPVGSPKKDSWKDRIEE